MKVFIPNEGNFKFTYPDEMEKIIKFVEDRGTLNVKYPTLEKLWYAFSETWCAEFLIPDEATMSSFIYWMNDLEVDDALKMNYDGEIGDGPYRNSDGVYL